MKRLLIHTLCFLIPVCAMAQKEASFWYFGNRVGMDFNPGSPKAVFDSEMRTTMGSSSISDSAGNLLFYTNGKVVWNRFHDTMPGGTGLLGDPNAITSALIVRQAFSYRYFVFTADLSNEYPQINLGLHYSIVDLQADSGRGAVVVKNRFLHRNSAEKIAAVRHANNGDAWIVTAQLFTDSLHTYLLSDSGLSAALPNRNPGAILPGGNSGQMKFSPDGRYLAYLDAALFNDCIYLMDFDVHNGRLSNPKKIKCDHMPFGLEFSPSGKYLYVIDQYIYGPNSMAINQLPVAAIVRDTNLQSVAAKQVFPWWLTGAMQLGSDGKIYMPGNNMITIHNPELYGMGMGLDLNGLKVSNPGLGQYSSRGVPAFVSSYFLNRPYVVARRRCARDSIHFSVLGAEADSVCWFWGDGRQQTSLGKTETHMYQTSGSHKLRAVVWHSGNTDTVNYPLQVRDLLQLNLGNDTILCPGEVLLKDVNGAGFKSCLWNNGHTGTSMRIDSSGSYSVTVSNQYCSVADTIHVKYGLPGLLYIGPDTAFCHAFSHVISAGKPFQSYRWNTGDTTYALTVSSGGLYTLNVRDSNSCPATDSIHIGALQMPRLTSIPDTVSCLYTVLSISREGGVSYRWSTGDTGVATRVFHKGEIVLQQSLRFCSRADTFQVSVLPMPEPALGRDTVLCFGSVVLQPGDQGDFLWNTGETGPSLRVYAADTYFVTIRRNGCEASDSIVIHQCPQVRYYIPDAFSPDGDGHNDVFRVFGAHISNLQIVVFNRWGEQISESGGVDAFWDGTYQGQSCPQDVYLYTIRVTGLDGSNDFVSGLIHLLR